VCFELQRVLAALNAFVHQRIIAIRLIDTVSNAKNSAAAPLKDANSVTQMRAVFLESKAAKDD
jgi:hypothetical protein